MPYYPLNRITPNLYTPGGEWQVKSIKEEYIGYYHKTFTGQYYTGRTPQDKPNRILIQFKHGDYNTKNDFGAIDFFNEDSNKYNFGKKIKNKSAIIEQDELPQYKIVSPTDTEYYLGEFTRYFCRKRNEPIFIEVTKEDFDEIRSDTTGYAYSLYKPFKFPWKITGEPIEVATVNKNMVEYVEKTSQVKGFSKFLTNYTEFYAYYTNGTEFVLPDGSPYSGLYHIHPGKGPMVGAKHVSTPHAHLRRAGEILVEAPTPRNTLNPVTGSVLLPTSTTSYSSAPPILSSPSPTPTPTSPPSSSPPPPSSPPPSPPYGGGY